MVYLTVLYQRLHEVATGRATGPPVAVLASRAIPRYALTTDMAMLRALVRSRPHRYVLVGLADVTDWDDGVACWMIESACVLSRDGEQVVVLDLV